MSMSGYDWSDRRWSAAERLFVMEYLKDFNAAAAAKRAGSQAKPDNLRHVGYQYLQKPHIQRAIEWHVNQLFDAEKITVERIVRELAMIAFADMAPIFGDDGEIKPFVEWPEHCRRAAASLDIKELFDYDDDGERVQSGVTKSVRFSSKIDALQILARWRKMLTDKEVHTERTVVERYYDGKARDSTARSAGSGE